MRIGIDIDDTITYTTDDIDSFVLENGLATKIFKENYHLTDRYNDWDMDTVESFWKNYGDKVISNPRVRDDAVKYINKLYNDGYEIIIITKRKKHEYDISKEYLDKYGIKYNQINVDVREKGKFCIDNNIDIMIDDSPYNAIDCIEQKVNFLLMDQEYNKNVNTVRANNWEDIYNLITGGELWKKE